MEKKEYKAHGVGGMTVREFIIRLLEASYTLDAVIKIPYPDNGIGVWPITGFTYNKEVVELYADTDDKPDACTHEGWNFKEHGRVCNLCGTFMIDFGD